MISYRPFRNTDPPKLAEVWRSQPPLRRRAQGINVECLERYVFSKPYFDREGLVVAVEDDYLLGFAHGGFGPSKDETTLSYEVGVVSALLTSPNASADVAGELLTMVEAYLADRGAARSLASGADQWRPFYLGLYGGAELPGVLTGDPAKEAFLDSGYSPQGGATIFQRSLVGFRPPVDRSLMQVRRSFHIEATLDPPAKNWWDACTLADADRTEFCLETRDHRELRERVIFSEMEQMSNSWGVRAVGLTHWEEPKEEADHNVLLFLLAEAMRQLQSQGVSLVETQLPADATEAPGRMAMLQRLGFEEVDHGEKLWKELS